MLHKNVAGATHGRFTHLTTEDAPDMVYGMLIVHGAIILVLFDSGATYSYISTKFE